MGSFAFAATPKRFDSKSYGPRNGKNFDFVAVFFLKT